MEEIEEKTFLGRDKPHGHARDSTDPACTRDFKAPSEEICLPRTEKAAEIPNPSTSTPNPCANEVFPPQKKDKTEPRRHSKGIFTARAMPDLRLLPFSHSTAPAPCPVGFSSKRNSSGNHGLGSSLPVWRSWGVYFPSLIILSRCSRMVRSRLAWQGHRGVSGIPQGVPKAGPGSPIDVEPTLTLP